MDRGLTELFRYNLWANRALVDACADAAEDQLIAAQPSTSESVAEVLLHLVGAQENYVHWLRGEAFQSRLDRGSNWLGLEQVSRAAEQTSEALIATAATIDGEANVDIRHGGALHRYPVGLLIASAIEHGIRHRTEIARMLQSVGVPAPDLDVWSYGRTVGHGRIVG
jgi:uncharacterized damage-inducible protein DinB